MLQKEEQPPLCKRPVPHLLRNLQQQAEQVPHLSQIARDTLERLQQPVQVQSSAPRDHWTLRLLGAALIGAGTMQGLAPLLATWPAWLMVGGGLYLVLRR